MSYCRAEAACNGGNPFLRALAAGLSGMGSGHTKRDPYQENHAACIENNLSAQRANAGIQDTTVRCVSSSYGDNQVKTVCH